MIRCLIVLLLMVSCATGDKKPVIVPYQKSYKFTDISGDFSLWVESGKKGPKEVFTKRKLIGVTNDLEFERVVAISDMGSVKLGKTRLNVLRPKISQYTVWFDKKRYFVQQEVIKETKKLKVTMKSPERKWQGVKEYSFPSTRGVFCFYAQLIDCVKMTSFIQRSIVNKTGKMHLTIVWEGFPYVSEQYDGIYKSPFVKANLIYDGLSRDKLHVFNLEFNNQIIFYHLNEDLRVEKKFWVSQGLTQVGY